MRRLLHVGCGPQNKWSLKGFATHEWEEVRLDIAAGVKPDIIGKLTDMGAAPRRSFDAVFSAHNIEHVFAHEVPLALGEFHRVLKRDGFAVVTCPDLQTVCERVATTGLLEPLYVSPMGPIAALDVMYGHRPSIAAGNVYMAHKCGFTLPSLTACLREAGFKSVHGVRRIEAFELWAIACKEALSQPRMTEIAQAFFP